MNGWIDGQVDGCVMMCISTIRQVSGRLHFGIIRLSFQDMNDTNLHKFMNMHQKTPQHYPLKGQDLGICNINIAQQSLNNTQTCHLIIPTKTTAYQQSSFLLCFQIPCSSFKSNSQFPIPTKVRSKRLIPFQPVWTILVLVHNMPPLKPVVS